MRRPLLGSRLDDGPGPFGFVAHSGAPLSFCEGIALLVRIALIHAVLAAMMPIEQAFRDAWPEVRRTNLFDDSLAPDREAAGALTPELSDRMVALATYAAGTGANGVLFTCSAFGTGIEAAAQALPIPVLKPNEAMFEVSLEIGVRLGMLATFPPAVASMEDEFRELARRRNVNATLETYVVPGASAALARGDQAEHNRLIADATSILAHTDAILLAHFSMAPAEGEARRRSERPILAAPSSAVAKLRRVIEDMPLNVGGDV